MKDTPLQIRDELRAFLNSGLVNMAEMERVTPLSKSWLSKFRRGEMNNPTIDQLEQVNIYRLAFLKERARAERSSRPSPQSAVKAASPDREAAGAGGAS